MGDETGQVAASFMRRDLDGTISAARTQWCDLASVSGVGVRSSSISLLSLPLHVCESGNDLKVK